MLINKIGQINKHNLVRKNGVDANGVSGTAVFLKNSTIKKRYFLEKRWSNGNKVLVAIMMNPSKASEFSSDDTVDQLINDAKSKKYDALYVLNLSPKIEGTSGKLKMSDFDYDYLNWEFIKEACESTNDDIFIGWGMKGQKGLKRQLKQVKKQNTLFPLLLQFKSRYVCYELKASKSKSKYDPKYYVPHPRPWFDKKKYVMQSFKQLDDINKVFIQPK